VEKRINPVPLFISTRLIVPILDPIVTMARYDDEPNKFPTGELPLIEKVPVCPLKGPLRKW
jgi:hypothetical protein